MPSRQELSSVVIPTDFSAGANQALERALRLPLAPRAKISLVHVLPDDIPGKLRKEAELEAERGLEKLLVEMRPLILERKLAPRQIVLDVLEGDPTQEILKRARSVDADVIVIGRHGKRSLTSLLIGSTSRKVVKLGDVPVLLVQKPVSAPYERALIAVDLGKGSARQIKTAATFLGAAKDVTVMHAASIPYADYVLVPQDDTEKNRERIEKEATKELNALIKRGDLPNAKARVLGGDARLLIAQEAELLTSELVVVATRGTSGLKRLVLGSTSEWVMTNSTADVLVTRA